MEKNVKIIHKDLLKQIIIVPVLTPDEVDLQGDIISKEEIEAACWRYNQTKQIVGFRHIRELDAVVLESYIVRGGSLSFSSHETKSGEYESCKEGSWIAVIKINDPIVWAGIMDGTYQSISIGGYADSTPIDTGILTNNEEGDILNGS